MVFMIGYINNSRDFIYNKTNVLVKEIQLTAKAAKEVIKTREGMILLAVGITLFALAILSGHVFNKHLIGVLMSTVSNFPMGRLFALISVEKTLQYKRSLYAPFASLQGDVALVLEAEHDHNGAFERNSFFGELEKTYSVAFRKVSHIKDIEDAIKAATFHGNTIKLLWLSAHGSPDHITLGKEAGVIWEGNVDALSNCLQKLDPEANIVLDSCSTGGARNNNLENIAQRIARCAKGRKVWCATDITNRMEKIDSVSPFKVTLSQLKWGNQGDGLMEKIKLFTCAVFYGLSFRHSFFARDLTTTYQYT